MIGVKFDRDRTQHFIDCLVRGSPLGDVAIPDELPLLAGAAMAVANAFRPDGDFGVSTAGLSALSAPPGHEDVPRNFGETLVVQFCAAMARKMIANEYDAEHPPVLRAIAYLNDGQPAYALLANHEGN